MPYSYLNNLGLPDPAFSQLSLEDHPILHQIPDGNLYGHNGNMTNSSAVLLLPTSQGATIQPPSSFANATQNMTTPSNLLLSQPPTMLLQQNLLQSQQLHPQRSGTTSAASYLPSRRSEALPSGVSYIQYRNRDSCPPNLFLQKESGALNRVTFPGLDAEVPLSGFVSALQSSDISEEESTYSPADTVAALAHVTQADGSVPSSGQIRASILELLAASSGHTPTTISVTRTCSMPKQARPHPPITRQQRRTAFEPLMGGNYHDFR